MTLPLALFAAVASASSSAWYEPTLAEVVTDADLVIVATVGEGALSDEVRTARCGSVGFFDSELEVHRWLKGWTHLPPKVRNAVWVPRELSFVVRPDVGALAGVELSTGCGDEVDPPLRPGDHVILFLSRLSNHRSTWVSAYTVWLEDGEPARTAGAPVADLAGVSLEEIARRVEELAGPPSCRARPTTLVRGWP